MAAKKKSDLWIWVLLGALAFAAWYLFFRKEKVVNAGNYPGETTLVGSSTWYGEGERQCTDSQIASFSENQELEWEYDLAFDGGSAYYFKRRRGERTPWEKVCKFS